MSDERDLRYCTHSHRVCVQSVGCVKQHGDFTHKLCRIVFGIDRSETDLVLSYDALNELHALCGQMLADWDNVNRHPVTCRCGSLDCPNTVVSMPQYTGPNLA